MLVIMYMKNIRIGIENKLTVWLLFSDPMYFNYARNKK